ncbi:hypothetical protein D3C81_1440430 [compost metagenome]
MQQLCAQRIERALGLCRQQQLQRQALGSAAQRDAAQAFHAVHGSGCNVGSNDGIGEVVQQRFALIEIQLRAIRSSVHVATMLRSVLTQLRRKIEAGGAQQAEQNAH